MKRKRCAVCRGPMPDPVPMWDSEKRKVVNVCTNPACQAPYKVLRKED